MNANGMARGYLAKQASTEAFLKHFKELIGRVLEEYEEEFELKHEALSFAIEGKSGNYHLELSEKILKDLKERSPYALDRYFWSKLKQQGFPLKMEDHYMKTVMGNQCKEKE